MIVPHHFSLRRWGQMSVDATWIFRRLKRPSHREDNFETILHYGLQPPKGNWFT
jgi:hypothetical protein